MKSLKVLLPLLIILTTGCAAPSVILSDDGRGVKVGKSDPADNYSDIGPITAFDGKGCGAFGHRGTYDRVVVSLKNKGAQMGGDYVQIFTLTEPHFRPGCFDNIYKINGALFKKTSEAPTPLPIIQTKEQSGIDKIRELKALLDEGIITENEFIKQKGIVFSNGI